MRILGDGIHYHLIARCNNGEARFVDPTVCRFILETLNHYAQKYACAIYSYNIMPTHLHLMAMTMNGNTIDRVMHDFCLVIAKRLNREHQRTGHFWRHRYRSKIIDNDYYALACLRYQDRNPLKARLVTMAADWPWSSHRYYACGTTNALLTPHPSYLALGRTDNERQASYRRLVNDPTDKDQEESRFFEGWLTEGSRRYRKIEHFLQSRMTSFIASCHQAVPHQDAISL